MARRFHPDAIVTELTKTLMRRKCGWIVAIDGRSACILYGDHVVRLADTGSDHVCYWVEVRRGEEHQRSRVAEKYNESQGRDRPRRAVGAAERAMRAAQPTFPDTDPTMYLSTLVGDSALILAPRYEDARGPLMVDWLHTYYDRAHRRPFKKIADRPFGRLLLPDDR